ncbi:MAG: hypothetical protein P1U46_01035 [Patescibacteria group bacterium]|nr:hypothetical protein [Patescibacteria group bacterium]
MSSKLSSHETQFSSNEKVVHQSNENGSFETHIGLLVSEYSYKYNSEILKSLYGSLEYIFILSTNLELSIKESDNGILTELVFLTQDTVLLSKKSFD